MVPIPQEHGKDCEVSPGADEDRIVVSGMSGLFPQCHNVKEFSELLYNKINPITSDHQRWDYSHPEVAQHIGTVPELDRFDAQFFKVHNRLSNSMDAMSRKLLEHAYQAIYDAGLSPEHLSGKKVGVFVGSCFLENDKAALYVASSRNGYGLIGCSRTMFANRISYWLNLRGPSVQMDEACCGSIAALEQAYQALARGDCSAAIVGGANLCLHPQSSIHYSRILTLCTDGKSKSFDINADGCARSEAINVLFLQKAKDALRVYADVLHVKSVFMSTHNETIPQFGFYRDPTDVQRFLETFYEEAQVSPKAVEYVEAFGIAIPEADKSELQAIGELFCKNRKDPLLVGSVTSNIGYAGAASGISSLTKILLAYQKGKIPANLHCNNPRKDVPALQDGQMRILTEHNPFNRTFAAVNSMSVTGCIGHVLLQGRHKPKNPARYKSKIPRLVTLSGRQETAVQKIIDDLKSRPIDPEELALLHNAHSVNISGHLGRGFIILDTNAEQKTECLIEKCEYFDNARRPLWFVYSGMGSQWPGMGLHLMKIPIFAAAIERCQRALKPKGVDIVHIITTPNKTIFDNILHSFVGIAAIQIGLTDILLELGLVPDKIIGHSVGELGCAYADGCLTAEEMILSAYSRGLVSVQIPFIKGSMTAVGIGYEQIKQMVPPEIEVACHNSVESSTISGPADAMNEFVTTLTKKGIFAKEVPCSNIAYHSRYIADAGPELLKYLSEVIKNPRPRSERWVSTSVPQDRWNETAAKYSSAEYHTNNLLNPVLFKETSCLIPHDAVLVEIAPHGLLQAILKRSLPDTCKHIPLTRRGHPGNSLMVLEAIGKLYMEGYCPKVDVLYPKVEFPVSTETPMLSHLIKWAHEEKLPLPLYVSADRRTAAASTFVISIQDDEYSYLRGNLIRGRNVYPYAVSLVAAWDTLAMSLGEQRKQISVEFLDVKFYSQPILHDQRKLRLSVAIHRRNGRFEVMDESSKVVSGIILPSTSFHFKTSIEIDPANLVVNSNDIYKILYEKEYEYSDDFRSIHSTNSSLTEAYLIWNNNWVTLIDGLLQLNIMKRKHNAVSEPVAVTRIGIDIQEHLLSDVNMVDDKPTLEAKVIEIYNQTRCGGLVIEHLKFNDKPVMTSNNVGLKSLKFVPYFQNTKLNAQTALVIILQIVAENLNKETLNVIEILNHPDADTLFSKLEFIKEELPTIEIKFQQIFRGHVSVDKDCLSNVDLVFVQNLFKDDNIFQLLVSSLKRDSFVLSAEAIPYDKIRVRPSALYRVVASQNTGEKYLHLSHWTLKPTVSSKIAVTVRTHNDLALLSSTRDTLSFNKKLIILTCYPPVDGLKELVGTWRRDSKQNQIYLMMINHKIAQNQELHPIPELNLAYNIMDHGTIGGEYYVPFEIQKVTSQYMALRSQNTGDLNTLHWVEIPQPITSGIDVTVHYAGLNNLDVKRATGVYRNMNGDNFYDGSYGMDFSGITDSGAQVMGIVQGAASNRVKVIPQLLWPVPHHWTLEDAATVPLPYAHAFYCLLIKVDMVPNRSILVHGGAGALGQAVISIALAHDMRVFTTVSDIRKKHFMKKLFPELRDDHIGNSRDASFGDMILTLTKGVGVNYIINCVQGELREVSLKVVAPGGITLDTTQVGSSQSFSYRMSHMTAERSYISVDFSSIFSEKNILEMKKLQLLVSQGITRGYVRPLSRVTCAADEAPRAFRLMETSQHRGRVLLCIRDNPTASAPRIICTQNQFHVVLSDEESLGLQLADRLINRGAKKLMLHLPRSSPYLTLRQQSWQNLGIEVKLTTDNLHDSNIIINLLNEITKKGNIEGIYLVKTTPESKNQHEILCALDSSSRNLCPHLKNFAVISTDVEFGKQMCITRRREKLPATKLNLPLLKTVDNTKNPACERALSGRNVCDVLECALRSDHAVFLAHKTEGTKLSLLQKIANVAGMKIPKDISNSTTLKELGVTHEKAQTIAVLLREDYELSLSKNNIISLSVQKIQELEKTILNTELKEAKGLDVFFSHVDSDELIATTKMVFMPTLTSGASMRDDEFDVNQTYLCIVPGLEGNCQRFRNLCERIKVPAIVLQPGLDQLEETVQQLAERYAKVLLRKASLKNNYYLVGYESGVSIALEMAAYLEQHGLTGTIYCIGTSPEQFKVMLDEELQEFKSTEELQDAVIRHMYKLMIGDNSSFDFVGKLSWQDKVEACVRSLLGRVPHSAQYARGQIESAYYRIVQYRQYVPKLRPLNSKLVLLRAAAKQNKPIITSNSLQQYSRQPIAIHDLSMPLAHALKDLRCAAIINQYLDPDILEEFNMKNLCETYLLNIDTFTATAD